MQKGHAGLGSQWTTERRKRKRSLSLCQQDFTDFSEKSYEETKEMSVEDKRFMMIAEDSPKIVDGHYSLRLPFRRDDVSCLIIATWLSSVCQA